jgi:hypothetical protein
MATSSLRMFWAPALLSVACVISSVATADGSAAPAPQRFGSVTVLNGGVSSDEAQALAAERTRYPLRLVLASASGEYQVADSLTVLRDGVAIARIPDAGPQVLLDLPPGRYGLELRAGAFLQSRLVTVAGGGTTVNWTVPSPPQ